MKFAPAVIVQSQFGTLIKKYLSLVKFAHTIFAMPFALVGFFMGWFSWQQTSAEEDFNWIILLCVVLCMVFARNAAMGFNRYLDRDIDSENVRTQVREIPSGAIKPKNALIFVIINSLLFIGTTWFINPLCFFLSPVALLVILGYSYTKRFTALCHLVLGLGLALAPVGAFIAMTQNFLTDAYGLGPILLGVTVLTWVSGFDIIYALQDEEFDKANKLNSIPALLGKKKALVASVLLHVVTAGCLVGVGLETSAGWLYWVGAGLFGALLIYQHLLVKPDDLSKVNLAFFTTNGVASVVFGALVIVDLFLAA